jgi:hypothetical protein
MIEFVKKTGWKSGKLKVSLINFRTVFLEYGGEKLIKGEQPNKFGLVDIATQN